jgi:hypothetical protein
MKEKTNLRSPGVLLTLAVCSTLLIGKPLMAAGNHAIGGEDPLKKEKSKAKERAFTSLNNQSVRIFPDAWKPNMHVVAKNNKGKSIDFYVFDLEGTLLQNYKMKAKDHFKITGLARGTYVYRVFCGDEETAAGKFSIR